MGILTAFDSVAIMNLGGISKEKSRGKRGFSWGIVSFLVPIVFWFERAFGCDADIVGLVFGQFGQFHANAV
jgi:hypothetical protein